MLKRLTEARLLNEEALQLYQQGNYLEAIKLAERALVLQERLEMPRSMMVETLTLIGGAQMANGDFERAAACLQRVLVLAEQIFEPDDLNIATVLGNLALALKHKGEYDQAEHFYERAVSMTQKAPPVSSSLVLLGQLFNNLGTLYVAKGNYVRAEAFLRQALIIREKELHANHPNIAETINNLGALFNDKGDYDRSQIFYQRALEIREKTFGPTHPLVAQTLNNLGALFVYKGDYDKALQFLQRARMIYRATLSSDNPEIALNLDNLATIYMHKRDLRRAEKLHRRGLTIREKVLGPEHQDVAASLHSLATLYFVKDNFKDADPLLKRALLIREKVLGAEHPETTEVLSSLAFSSWAVGDYQSALYYSRRAERSREKSVSLMLTSGSLKQKQRYLNIFRSSTDFAIALHSDYMPQNAEAARLALMLILQRKGRALDAMSDSLTSIRRRIEPDNEDLLSQYSQALSEIASLQLSRINRTSSDDRFSLIELEARIQEVENSISVRSTAFPVSAEPITLEAVRKTMPLDSVLIEFFVHHNLNPKGGFEKSWGELRYVAYVLHPNDAVPRFINLGDVATIDKMANDFRRALRDRGSENYKVLARSLDERVMQPLRRLFGSSRRIFLAPDGSLNLIPFAALIDEKGRFLIDNYSINYLTSGRDLMRLQNMEDSREPPTIFANPLFDLNPKRSTIVQARGRSSATIPNPEDPRDFTALNYDPLPATAVEADEIAQIFPGTIVLTQAKATKAVLKKVHGPRILHIATHGFFLQDLSQKEWTRLILISPSEQKLLSVAHIENPLLRSGLILAGAKQGAGRQNTDGIMTALELIGLDLRGTKLVVLSACETGLGDIKNGEGVYGLRQALVLAGSETQVLSLWTLSDTATRILMVSYYDRLQRGEERTEALRKVQLAMLHATVHPSFGELRGQEQTNHNTFEDPDKTWSRDYSHPYYWAAFIASGNWRNLEGQEVPSSLEKPQ